MPVGMSDYSPRSMFGWPAHSNVCVLCVYLACRHQEYIVDNETYMRVKFYVDGSKRKGTVHVDLKKVSSLSMLHVNI